MIFRPRNRYTDADLDRWVARIIQADQVYREATHDYEAGLDEIYARAGRTRPQRPPQRAAAPEPDPAVDAALRPVVDHIEMLDALLAAVTRSDPDTSPFAGVIFLKTGRQFLHQLKTGLVSRRLTREAAIGLVELVAHDITEADKTLRAQHGLSLRTAVHQRIGDMLDVGGDLDDQAWRLREQITRLFADTDEPAPRVPVPQP